jgi:hypothetical protein
MLRNDKGIFALDHCSGAMIDRSSVSAQIGAPGRSGAVVGAYDIIAHDFNEDGHGDLAVTNFSDNSVGRLLGRRDGTFARQERTQQTKARLA